MKKPEKLYHATPTHNLEAILRDGLEPTAWTSHNPRTGATQHGSDPVNLSTEDETSLIAFFGEGNGCIDEAGTVVDTITLLEIDCTALELTWPGIDGDHHFECHAVVPPTAIRPVSTCSLDQVAADHKGIPLAATDTAAVFDAMAAAGRAHAGRTVLE